MKLPITITRSFIQTINTSPVVLCLAVALFLASIAYGFLLLEADSYVHTFFTPFGDAMAWVHSARIKHLHGVWFRGDMDDLRTVFMVPMHNLAAYIGFQLFDLTLTGLRFIPFLLVQLAKFVVLYIVYREGGRVFFIITLVFLAVYAPINEAGRAGSAEAAQIGLYAASMLTWYLGVTSKSRLLVFLAGMLIAVSAIYKMAALLFLMFPLVYTIVSVPVASIKENLLSIKSNLWMGSLGIGAILLPYFILWQIPYLDEIVYAAIREGGIQTGLVSPFDFPLLLRNIVELYANVQLYTQEVSFDRFSLGFHSFWLLGSLGFVAILMCVDSADWKLIDRVLLALVLTFFLQTVFYESGPIRRILPIMSVGLLALIRSLMLLGIANVEPELTKAKLFLRALAFSYCIYLALTVAIATEINHQLPVSQTVLFILCLVCGMVTYGLGSIGLLRKLCGVVMLLGFLWYLPEAAFYSKQYYLDVNDEIKQSSILMGQQAGTSRVLGSAHWFGLYNTIEASYDATSGQVKPDGWVYDDFGMPDGREFSGLDLREFADQKYRDNFWALKLKVFDWLYPGFLDRWYLPPGYEQRYQSNYFYDHPEPDSLGTKHHLYTHYAVRHLVIGASEENVYLAEGKLFTDIAGQIIEPKYYDLEKIVIPLPDSIANKRWYGLNENSTAKELRYRRLDNRGEIFER
jgi:hypothetical protein